MSAGLTRTVRAVVRAAFVALLGFGWLASASAQTYPAKPIQIVVPFPVGGIADIYARLIGSRLADAWGQPVVVENRTGAGGNIGAELVAKSAPDGYTLVMGSIGTHAVNVTLFSKMPYDPVRDFAPVVLVLDADACLSCIRRCRRRRARADRARARQARRAELRLRRHGHGEPSRGRAVQDDGAASR